MIRVQSKNAIIFPNRKNDAETALIMELVDKKVKGEDILAIAKDYGTEDIRSKLKMYFILFLISLGLVAVGCGVILYIILGG